MKNMVQGEVETLRITVGSGVVSGDLVFVGKICGVAETDYSAIDGKATIRVVGSYNYSVKAVDDAGNSAVALGDRLYWTTGDTPKISKKASGQLVGVALATITSGSTATIEVGLIGMRPVDTGAHIADVGAAGGTYSQAEVNAIGSKVNAVIAALEAQGILANA